MRFRPECWGWLACTKSAVKLRGEREVQISRPMTTVDTARSTSQNNLPCGLCYEKHLTYRQPYLSFDPRVQRFVHYDFSTEVCRYMLPG